jgi:hypothetical protein
LDVGLLLLTGSCRTGLKDCPGLDGRSNCGGERSNGGNPDLMDGNAGRRLSGGVKLLDGTRGSLC